MLARALAGEVNVGDRGHNADLNAIDFGNLCRSVLASCVTPERRTHAAAARDLYDGIGASLALLSVHELPPLLAKSAPAFGWEAPLPGVPDDTSATAKEFRLRAHRVYVHILLLRWPALSQNGDPSRI